MELSEMILALPIENPAACASAKSLKILTVHSLKWQDFVDFVKLALSNKNLNGSTCPRHWEPRRVELLQLSPKRGNRETWSPEILSSSVSICHVAPWAWNTVEKQYGLNQSYFVTVVNYLESSREKQKCVAKVKIFSLNLHETVSYRME